MSTDRKTVFHALHDAIDWQSGLADAYRHIPDSPERAEALVMVRRYKAVLCKRYGTDQHAGEAKLDAAPLVSLTDIMKRHK